MATTWIRYGIPAGDFNAIDTYPLWIAKGDTFEFVPEILGSPIPPGADPVFCFKFFLDSNLDLIRAYCTATTATIILRVFLGGVLIAQRSRYVEAREAISLEVPIKEHGYSSGEGEIHLLAKGNYLVEGETIKVAGFYRAGWSRHTQPDTDWGRHEQPATDWDRYVFT